MNDYSNNTIAYLLLGGNMGNRLYYLQTACTHIQQLCGNINKRSALYKTAAWGNTNQQPFYNACIEVQTKLHPIQLMERLLLIEEKMGRIRQEKYGPRTIDLDILLIPNTILKEPILTVPHQHLTTRRFALTPLADIAATEYHPIENKTILQLLTICTDNSPVTAIGCL